MGVGDAGGMDLPYRLCNGMGGLRTAGDLVARAQLEKKMKIHEAKRYVAGKLGVSVDTLSDEYEMKEIREKYDIGLIISLIDHAKGLAAKTKIAEFFNYKINSVSQFYNRIRK